MTRVPANPRTEMELEQKSMTTKIQDAQSVIEDEEVVKTLDLKSLAEDVLVIKAKKPMPMDAEDKAEGDEGSESDAEDKAEGAEEPADKKKKKVVKSLAENTVLTPVTQTPVEKSLVALIERIATLKSQGLTGDQALAEIQKNFDELGNVVKAEFTVPPSPEELAKQNMAEIVRSALSEMLPQALAQFVVPLQSELTE